MTTPIFPTRLSGVALLCAATLAATPAGSTTQIDAYFASDATPHEVADDAAYAAVSEDPAAPYPEATGDDAGEVQYEPAFDVEPVVVEALTPAQLEALIGPVALYPDTLLAVVLPAATFPLQIVQAARLLDALESDPDLKPDPAWDSSVVALLNYPEVIRMMNEDLDWTYALGDAVATQQSGVIAAIESFRDQAWDAGNLQSDDYVEVVREEEVISITPIEEEVIHVPYYEPERVVVVQPAPVVHYYPRPYPVYYYPYPDRYAFSTGVFFGVSTAYQIGWGSRFLHLHRHSYASHPFYGRRYVPGFYYHERFHRAPRATFSRGGYVAERDRGWRAGRAYRGDRWQAIPRRDARVRARDARRSDRGIARSTFRPRDANVVRTTPRASHRALRERREAREQRTNRSVPDAAMRSRVNRRVADREEPRDRRSRTQSTRRDANSILAVSGGADRRNLDRTVRERAPTGDRAGPHGRDASRGGDPARSSASASAERRQRQDAAMTSGQRRARSAEQRAEQRAQQRRADRRVAAGRAAATERRASRSEPNDDARRTVQRDRRAATAERTTQPRRSAQRERRATAAERAGQNRRSAPRERQAASRETSRSRSSRATRGERKSSPRAERASRRSGSADKRSRSGRDAGRRSQQNRRDRR